MTREEAIKEIIRAYDVLDFSCHMDNRRKEAFNMAKAALEQEPYKVSEYDKDHIWYKGVQYISLRRFLEAKSEEKNEPCEDAISKYGKKNEGEGMTRQEENRIVVNEMNKRAESKPVGTYEEMVSFQLGAIATMLADISKSLAIFADKTESEDKK